MRKYILQENKKIIPTIYEQLCSYYVVQDVHDLLQDDEKKKDRHNNYHCEFQAQCTTTMKMGFM